MNDEEEVVKTECTKKSKSKSKSNNRLQSELRVLAVRVLAVRVCDEHTWHTHDPALEVQREPLCRDRGRVGGDGEGGQGEEREQERRRSFCCGSNRKVRATLPLRE